MNPPTRRTRASAAIEEEGRAAEKSVEAHKDSGLVTFLAETVIAFVFWTSLSEGIPALWYVPMNKMAISGAEVCLFFYALPALLTIRSFREVCWNTPLLHLVAVLPLLALYVPTVLMYGAGVMLGSSLHLTHVIGQLLHPSPSYRDRRILTIFAGLIAFIAVRFGLSSISPLYMYPTANVFAIVLVIISAFFLQQNRPAAVKALPPAKSFSAFSTDIGAGVGFGALLFLNVMFLSEHGVLARWNNADPFPIGLGMMATVVVGFFLSRYPFVRSWGWYLMGVASCIAFIYLNNPLGAVIGYGFLLYQVTVWPAAVESLSRMVYIGRGLGFGGIVYLVSCLGTVWCVAYNFVPGGFYVREWTPYLVYLALFLTKFSYSSSPSAVTAAPNPAASAPREKNALQANWRAFLITLVLIALLIFTPAFLKRFSSYNNFDAHGLDKTNLRGMVWATHFGYDNFGRPSYEDMLDLIKKSEANVIALVESDIMRLFNGNRDMGEWLQEHLHMYLDYGPDTNTHTWGCAILSAYPFKRVERVVLPSPDGENACLIDTTLDVNGKDVEFIMAHFGNTEHVRDRELQTLDSYKRLKAAVDANKRVAWFGYFTSPPGSPNYNKIMSAGVIDSTDAKDRYCEYIWYKNMKLKDFKRIEQGHVSDTEIQYASFEPF